MRKLNPANWIFQRFHKVPVFKLTLEQLANETTKHFEAIKEIDGLMVYDRSGLYRPGKYRLTIPLSIPEETRLRILAQFERDAVMCRENEGEWGGASLEKHIEHFPYHPSTLEATTDEYEGRNHYAYFYPALQPEPKVEQKIETKEETKTESKTEAEPKPPKAKREPKPRPVDPESIVGFSEEDSQKVLSKRRGKARVKAYIEIIIKKDGGECKRLTKDMAEQLGVSTSAFSASMRKLVKEGVLLITNHKYKRGETGRTYQLAAPITAENVAEFAEAVGVEWSELVVANGRKVYQQVGQNKFKKLGEIG